MLWCMLGAKAMLLCRVAVARCVPYNSDVGSYYVAKDEAICPAFVVHFH